MKQGGTTESQVKGEIHEGMTNNEKHRSPEFLENGNVGVRSFRKMETSEFRSFPEMENIGNSGVSGNRVTSKIHIPRKLTGVPGCVRTVGTDSNSISPLGPNNQNRDKWGRGTSDREGGRDRGGVMGGILKDPGIRTEAWSERMERKASGSRGKLCGDESHTTEWWGKK